MCAKLQLLHLTSGTATVCIKALGRHSVALR